MDLRLATRLWYVLLAAQGLNVALGLVGPWPQGEGSFAQQVPAFAQVLGVVAFATILLARFLWSFLHRRARAQTDPQAAAQGHFSAALVTWVMEESVSIHALLLAAFGHPERTWLLFSALAFVAFLSHRPSLLEEVSARPPV